MNTDNTHALTANNLGHAENCSPLERFSRKRVLDRLGRITRGELLLIDGGERTRFGSSGGLRVTINVNNPAFYRKLLFGGAIGVGESYINGDWQCNDLTALVQLFLANRNELEAAGAGFSWLQKPLLAIERYLRRNTLSGSRRNIGAHYDLGNDFFELFLDDTMMYSCGIFHTPRESLKDASEAKLESICQKLELGRGDQVIEIGTGWGGFALHAARHYGCHVTTTTISRQQYEFARRQVAQAGLTDRIEILLKDYRELDGQYDKLVSIEMIEAVGHENFDRFFSKCSSLMKPHGMMLLQAITISDQRYPVARRSTDFIQKYIFPGGCLPSVSAIADSVARRTDMRIYHLEDIGAHYAETLRHWKARFFANIDRIRQLGYSENFLRMWEFYLSYCEGGFRHRSIGTAQILLTKPACAREPIPGHRYT